MIEEDRVVRFLFREGRDAFICRPDMIDVTFDATYDDVEGDVTIGVIIQEKQPLHDSNYECSHTRHLLNCYFLYDFGQHTYSAAEEHEAAKGFLAGAQRRQGTYNR